MTKLAGAKAAIEKSNKSRPKKKRHPAVIYWIAFCATIGGLLFGYDTGIINGALLLIDEDMDLTTLWKESIVTSTVFAAALLSIFSGTLADKFGRKPSIMAAGIVFTIGAIVMAFAPNKELLFIGRFTVGGGIGIVSSIVPVYVSECSPKEIRGFLITLNQLFITIGIVLSAVLAGVLQHVPHGWRIMLGLGAVPGVIQVIFFMKLPETPRYMVMQNKIVSAEAILKRIRCRDDDIHEELREIKEAVEQDKENRGIKVWGAIWKTPHVRRALFVGCMLQAFQQFCGINAVIYYSATILKSSGFSSTNAVWLSVIPFTVNFLATFLGLWAVEKLGRKHVLALSFLAIAVSCAVLSAGFVMGSKDSPKTSYYNDLEGSYGTCAHYSQCDPCIRLSESECGYCAEDNGDFREKGACVKVYKDDKKHWANKGRCSKNNTSTKDMKLMTEFCPNSYNMLPVLGLILFVLSFAPGAGPMPWTINAEIYPIWARSVANSIATFTNWMCNVAVSFTFMTLVRTFQGYGTFFIYLNVCIAGTLFVMLFVPETKGKSLEEIQYLFMSNQLQADHAKKQSRKTQLSDMPAVPPPQEEQEQEPETNGRSSTRKEIPD